MIIFRFQKLFANNEMFRSREKSAPDRNILYSTEKNILPKFFTLSLKRKVDQQRD